MEPVTEPILLLAEDDPDLAFLFQRVFERFCPDWKLVWAANGVVAVDHIMENGMPRAVVTDLYMPIMSGFELISWIRAKNHHPRVPIIAMSSLIEPELRDKFRQLGADDFVSKTHAPEKLQHVLLRLYATLDPDEFLNYGVKFQHRIIPRRECVALILARGCHS